MSGGAGLRHREAPGGVGGAVREAGGGGGQGRLKGAEGGFGPGGARAVIPVGPV